MTDPNAPIKGKCTFWRERPSVEDEYDVSVKGPDKRVDCSCFVEGHFWTHTRSDVPDDCPKARECRYYIRA